MLSRLSLTDTPIPITPYLQAGVDHTTQERHTLGTGGTALNIDKLSATRLSYGGGAQINQTIGEKASLQINSQYLRHVGDTETALFSRFGRSDQGFSASGGTVEEQFLIETNMGLDIQTDDLSGRLSLEGFAEFGDLEGFGGRLSLATSF